MGYRDGWVYVDGRLVPAARAKISVFDRGFLYGDGLFETMRAYTGHLFALDEHLERLGRSAETLGIVLPNVSWAEAIGELLRRNRLLRRDAWVRLNVTRGVAEPNLLPPTDMTPTTVILVKEVPPLLAKVRRRGVDVSLLTHAGQRSTPEHKSLNYLPGVVGKAAADSRGSYEGLFVRDGKYLTEGTTSSVFVVRDGRLATPPCEGILPGVTRRVVIDLAKRAGIPCAERALTTASLRRSDEVFLTSSVAEIVPAVSLGGMSIGDGHPGQLTRKLQRLYRGAVRRSRGK
jgi:branched-chain amino acid aminotransferase